MTKFIDSFHPFPAPRRITRWCRPNYQQQRCWCQERSALAMASGIFNGKARYVHETNPRQEILWIKIGGTAWHITTDREQPEEAHGLIRAMARQRVRSRERWATFARRCWRGPHAVAATAPGPIPLVNSRRWPISGAVQTLRAGAGNAREPNPKLGGDDRPTGVLRTTKSPNRREIGCRRDPPGSPHAEGMPQPLRFAQPCAHPAPPTPRRARWQRRPRLGGCEGSPPAARGGSAQNELY